MANTTTSARKNQSVSTEKVDVMEVGDWTLSFTYRSVNDAKPTELAITGNKKTGGFVNVNVGQMGLDTYGINFNPRSCFDIEILQKINDEIELISG